MSRSQLSPAAGLQAMLKTAVVGQVMLQRSIQTVETAENWMECKLQMELTDRMSVQVLQTHAITDYHTLTTAITIFCITPGCGAAIEDPPYLEFLCVSDPASNTHQSLTADGEGAQEATEANAVKSPQSYEKQGSLITLAWSKLPEDDNDSEEEAAQVQPIDISSTDEHTHGEETSEERDKEDLKPTHHHPDVQSAGQQSSTVSKVV